MFPRVYQTLTANATVVAMVGNRIGRHGVIQQTETRPYITWQIVLGQPYDTLHRITVGDEIRWVRERAHIRFNGTGKAIFAVGTVQDVTDRKRDEDELIRHQPFFKLPHR